MAAGAVVKKCVVCAEALHPMLAHWTMSSTRKNPEKTKRAAAHPERPGEECKAAPASYAPLIDRARCEGKADCVEVCPYDVFEVGPIADDEYRALPLLSRFKVWAHGKKTALTPNATACQACGLCVVACPEKAITLRRVAP